MDSVIERDDKGKEIYVTVLQFDLIPHPMTNGNDE